MKQKLIKALPFYLIIYFDSFKQDLKLKYPATNIPKPIDFTDLLRKQGIDVEEGRYVYRLGSFVSLEKEDEEVDNVEFSANIHKRIINKQPETRFLKDKNLIKKKLKSKIEVSGEPRHTWLRYDKNRIIEVLGKDAREKCKTVTAVY